MYKRDRRGLAAACFLRGDADVAIEILEALIREGGPQRDALLIDLQIMRSERSRLRNERRP